MIITPTKLKSLFPKFQDVDDDLLAYKLEAIEDAIRSYTNNPFQIRSIRDVAFASGERLIFDDVPPFKIGDTIQITKCGANDGLYVVESITGNAMTLDHATRLDAVCLVTLVQYPSMIVSGAVKMLEWDCFDSDKVGVASETISRHSVSYQQYDGSNTINGYPSMLYGFCTPFMRART